MRLSPPRTSAGKVGCFTQALYNEARLNHDQHEGRLEAHFCLSDTKTLLKCPLFGTLSDIHLCAARVCYYG